MCGSMTGRNNSPRHIWGRGRRRLIMALTLLLFLGCSGQREIRIAGRTMVT